MRTFLLLLASVTTVGCSKLDSNWSIPEPLDPFFLQAAKTDAQRYLGSGAKILAICGASVGSSIFLDRSEEGFLEDGIDGGVIIFAVRNDGRPEVLTRDVSKQMIVASEDGAEITRLRGRISSDDLGVWALQYPSTGVVVSHNLATGPEGALINIWTQNKPEVGLLPARTSTFLSRCEAIS